MMRTMNPALNSKAFQSVRGFGASESMTIQGTINKAIGLLILLMLSAFWVWGKAFQSVTVIDAWGGKTAGNISSITPFIFVGCILGLVTAMVTVFKKEWSGVTAPVYALCEGLALGGFSAIFEMRYPGVVTQAVALTFGTLFSLLMLYKSGIIKATDKFRRGIFAATGAICLIYFVSFIMSFFGGSISMIHSSGIMGIGFSLFVVTIAALNLVLDFDLIEKGASMGCPKFMEWYAAFGLMVTLVWLYIEILRLLSKLRSRR